jgi:hypothetical protein
LDEAVRYYDHQLPGLGFRFFEEVDAAIERIRLMPEAWTKIGNQTRRCLIKGFPYAIHYTIETEVIEVILVTAIAHLHRQCCSLKVCGAGFPACLPRIGRLESLPHNPPKHLKSTALTFTGTPSTIKAELPAYHENGITYRVRATTSASLR